MTPHAQHNNFIAFFAVIMAVVVLGGLLVAGLQDRSPKFLPVTALRNYSPTGITSRPQDYFSKTSAVIDSPMAFSVGPKDAKVIFVEFLDFQCPYSQMEVPIVRQLMTMYKDSSVRFVIREMPIVKLYPQSITISEGALCAKEQGKYLEYHDYAFLHQQEIDTDSPNVFAKNIDLDMAAFGSCYSQKNHHQQIVNDLYDAQNLGLTGTPTFFINNERIVGAAMFSELKNAIDAALRK